MKKNALLFLLLSFYSFSNAQCISGCITAEEAATYYPNHPHYYAPLTGFRGSEYDIFVDWDGSTLTIKYPCKWDTVWEDVQEAFWFSIPCHPAAVIGGCGNSRCTISAGPLYIRGALVHVGPYIVLIGN